LKPVECHLWLLIIAPMLCDLSLKAKKLVKAQQSFRGNREEWRQRRLTPSMKASPNLGFATAVNLEN
jgi:hypothetical protein